MQALPGQGFSSQPFSDHTLMPVPTTQKTLVLGFFYAALAAALWSLITPFSRLLFDACGADNHWKNAAECTADLRCCDWKRKRLGYQKKGALIWRAFSGAPLSGGDPL